MGTLINVASVAIGSLFGVLWKKHIRTETNVLLMKVIGFVSAVMGILGMITNMLTVSNGTLKSVGILLLLVSLGVGALIGSALHLEQRLNRLSDYWSSKLKTEHVVQSFLTATLLYCVGAMTLMSPLTEALSGDYSLALMKTAIDGVAAIFLAASLGIGVLFSAFSILIVQGGIYLFSQWIAPFVVGDMIGNISIVGFAIVTLIGTNMLGATKIKTTDLLPALIIPVLWTLVGLGRF